MIAIGQPATPAAKAADFCSLQLFPIPGLKLPCRLRPLLRNVSGSGSDNRSAHQATATLQWREGHATQQISSAACPENVGSRFLSLLQILQINERIVGLA